MTMLTTMTTTTVKFCKSSLQRQAYPEPQPQTTTQASEAAPAPAAEPPKLDKIQQDAIDAAMEGKNIFLTG